MFVYYASNSLVFLPTTLSPIDILACTSTLALMHTDSYGLLWAWIAGPSGRSNLEGLVSQSALPLSLVFPGLVHDVERLIAHSQELAHQNQLQE